MKPRTKLQIEVMEYSSLLPYREGLLLPWAKKECLDHIGYAIKKRVACMDCGGSFDPDLVERKRAVCPHCKTTLKIEVSRKTTNKQRVNFAIAEVFRGYQVVRNYELYSYHKAGREPRYFFQEILQNWIREDGKHEMVGRNHTSSFCVDSWNGDMEIRKNYRKYYSYNYYKYYVYPFKYHPASQIKPEYQKYGITKKLQGLTIPEAIKMLPETPKAETLLKARQFNLLYNWSSLTGSINRYWPSIKICLRNKYQIKDPKMYFDYLDLLQYFGKDLRNAHYVCPKALKREHDKYVAKKRAILERERLEKKRQKSLENEENEEKYKAFIQCFEDLSFGDDDIVIRPLKSVAEFMEEGDTMHHCVFTNDYFNRRNSLILSAKLHDERMETIEFDLKKMKIVQSQGKFNTITDYHDRIIGLVNKNKKLIGKYTRNKLNVEHSSKAV